MPRQIFKNRVIASAGPPPESITLQNLRSWIPMRKGRFAEPFDDEVTHLLCTHEQFKKRVPLVKQVLKEHKRIHIVHYDWLEFSAVFNKRLPEREYSMRSIFAKEKAEQRERNRQENGRREGERGPAVLQANVTSLLPALFHIYRDREFFKYQIDLTRNNSEDGEFGQRYTMTASPPDNLWESNAKPHLYWFTAKFMRRKGDPNAAYHRPSICSGKWRREMNLFMDFFRIKTGIDWQDRVLLEGTTPLSAFQYCPPKGGKPIGRRLRFSYDCCVELNLEWKQQNLPQETSHETEDGDITDAVGSLESGNTDSDENDDHGNSVMELDAGFGNDVDGQCATQQIELGDAPKSEPLSTSASGISLDEGITEATNAEPSEQRPITGEV
ncbi:hypothetical protein LLEC1_03337 [Akanthomyces lecanii]|uniref:BRCT domain-containing protein n=1 Tax=Cordyceps confragosa TaxID=2714763 RepID=A0A179IBH9_CORDF|nr:hypothetical protein LLEC1_03337 [Akanthomyces lecanii]